MSRLPKINALVIQRPRWKVIILPVVTGLLTLLAVEIILRISWVQTALPDPTYKTDNYEFGIKVAQLDQLLAQRGSVDCVFLGSSAMDANGDPLAFAKGYQTVRGKPVVCYNFGLGGLASISAGRMARFLIARYQPQTVIYSVSALEMTDDFSTRFRSIYDKRWIHYVNGEFSVEGWLIDQSKFMQYLDVMNIYTDYEQRDVYEGYRQNIEDLGVNGRQGVYVYQSDIGQGIPNYKMNPDGVAGLTEFLALQSSTGTQLIVVEEPVYPDYFENNYLAGGPTAYLNQFLKPVEVQTQAAGAAFIHQPPFAEQLFPDDSWDDYLHLNAGGASLYCEWLGEQVGQLVAEGQLQELGR